MWYLSGAMWGRMRDAVKLSAWVLLIMAFAKWHVLEKAPIEMHIVSDLVNMIYKDKNVKNAFQDVHPRWQKNISKM